MASSRVVVFKGRADEANVIAGVLEASGIESVRENEALGGLLPYPGGANVLNTVRVVVDEADAERAKEIIASRDEPAVEEDLPPELRPSPENEVAPGPTPLTRSFTALWLLLIAASLAITVLSMAAFLASQ